MTVLTAFVAYASWAAFVNKNYYAGRGPAPGPDLALLLPLPHRKLRARAATRATVITWWTISPALLILIFPLGFRMTCYYYRKAYYRSFWLAPPACAVSDGHGSYSGESRFPLLLQNVHRYFFYFGLVFNVILTIDAIMAFRQPGFGIGHQRGHGRADHQRHPAVALLPQLPRLPPPLRRRGQAVLPVPIRHRIWKTLTPLNARHMLFAWMSLVFVALTDFYVRLVASGTIHDYGFHF